MYKHLVCEFSHWDHCLTGLVRDDGAWWFCRSMERSDGEQVEYTLSPIRWNAECDEYLDEYREAYAHWFHDVQPRVRYDGRSLRWFAEKWRGRNPIEEQSR